MPRKDGTGPAGTGARTGRGLGNCTPQSSGFSGTTNTAAGRPQGLGARVCNGTFGRLFRLRRTGRNGRR